MTYLPAPDGLSAEQVAAWHRTVDVHNGDELAFREWFELKVAATDAITDSLGATAPCPWCQRQEQAS